MENNQEGYAKMAEFVDALIAQKYPGDAPENHADLREKLIESLGEHIDAATDQLLTTEQAAELAQLLADQDETNYAKTYFDYFTNHGIDFQQKVQDAMIEFGQQFLGANYE